jgi:hypothetical protein
MRRIRLAVVRPSFLLAKDLDRVGYTAPLGAHVMFSWPSNPPMRPARRNEGTGARNRAVCSCGLRHPDGGERKGVFNDYAFGLLRSDLSFSFGFAPLGCELLDEPRLYRAGFGWNTGVRWSDREQRLGREQQLHGRHERQPDERRRQQ